jgi:hypothetical protein
MQVVAEVAVHKAVARQVQAVQAGVVMAAQHHKTVQRIQAAAGVV